MNRRTAIAWALGPTGADPFGVDHVGAEPSDDASLELSRSLHTETELVLCALVAWSPPGAGGGTHPLRWANR